MKATISPGLNTWLSLQVFAEFRRSTSLLLFHRCNRLRMEVFSNNKTTALWRKRMKIPNDLRQRAGSDFQSKYA